jgi:hypothetical protein
MFVVVAHFVWCDTNGHNANPKRHAMLVKKNLRMVESLKQVNNAKNEEGDGTSKSNCQRLASSCDY